MFVCGVIECSNFILLHVAVQSSPIEEIVFSPFGYWVCKNWKKDDIGRQYFDYVNGVSYESVSDGK